MPDSDEHEDDIYEDEEVELSDDDPPEDKVKNWKYGERKNTRWFYNNKYVAII